MAFENKSSISILFLVFVVFLLQASCGCAEYETFFIFDEQETKDEWTYPVSLAVLDDPMDVLRLINRDNLLEKEYPDQSIDMYKMVNITAPTTKGKLTIRSIVNEALIGMIDDAEAEGIKLYVGSAYRDYRTQEVMHFNRVKRLGKDDGIVQMAGASEHQAGLAADLVSWEYRDGFKTSFGNTKEGKWLAANCAKYGFIIRYPEDKISVTGVKFEPWHVRYVGIEAATYIMQSGMAFEEFTEEWKAELIAYEQAKVHSN